MHTEGNHKQRRRLLRGSLPGVASFIAYSGSAVLQQRSRAHVHHLALSEVRVQICNCTTESYRMSATGAKIKMWS